MAGMLPLPSLIRASAHDAASARMRKAGRSKWSRGDYNEAVRTFDRLRVATYGEGLAGLWRFQVAEYLQRRGVLTLSMTPTAFNAAIDVALAAAAAHFGEAA